jgi:hypothetical protein
MDFESFYRTFAIVSGYSVIVPLSFCIVCLPFLKKVGGILLIYLALSLLTEVIFYFFSSRNASVAKVGGELFAAYEFVCVSIFYSAILKTGKGAVLTFFFGYCLLIYCIRLTFGGDTVHLFQSGYIFLFFVFGVVYFLRGKSSVASDEQNNSLFWLNSGFFYYFGTSFLLFVFEGFIMHAGESLSRYIWSLHLVNNMVFYGILTYGVWESKRV